ncbi:MAG: metal dependent phosphohydrolase [Clostridia bacterium]|jgi:hypothetical protein|uniref:hypothetical protein n=1 Tax=Petroclostridium xylanilyticum TaxID=1792311 RepID=UPI000B99BE2E|nr:hypothetical protein [Petroclostridium xylanilyticum]MBZ4647418.1 metal dependent phosphohydrolase [Clostridia bacterium]
MITYFDNNNPTINFMEKLSDFKIEFGISCLRILLVEKNKIFCSEEIDAANSSHCCDSSLVLEDVYLSSEKWTFL